MDSFQMDFEGRTHYFNRQQWEERLSLIRATVEDLGDCYQIKHRNLFGCIGNLPLLRGKKDLDELVWERLYAADYLPQHIGNLMKSDWQGFMNLWNQHGETVAETDQSLQANSWVNSHVGLYLEDVCQVLGVQLPVPITTKISRRYKDGEDQILLDKLKVDLTPESGQTRYHFPDEEVVSLVRSDFFLDFKFYHAAVVQALGYKPGDQVLLEISLSKN